MECEKRNRKAIRSRRTSAYLAAALIVSLGAPLALPQSSLTAEAISGWTRDTDGEWVYLNTKDEPMTDLWRKSGDNWYYLGQDGKMLKSCVLEDGNERYYLDADGRMVRNAWVQITDEDGDSTSGGLEPGWYYFGANGKGYRRRGTGFKKLINGKTYAFDDEGKMLTGFLTNDGEQASEDEALTDAVYYADEESGALCTNDWVDYGGIADGNTGGVGGSALDSQLTDRSYDDYEKMWMYFGSNSKKVYSKKDTLLQKKINGVTYAFDENGIMNPWWTDVQLATPATADDPENSDRNRTEPYVKEGEKLRYYSGYDGGQIFKNKWFWMYPSENLDADDYDNEVCSWWYAGTDGNVYRDQIRKVNGRSYAFDGIGRMRTGFVAYADNRNRFVGQWDLEDLTSEDFKKGRLTGWPTDSCDLFLFSPDELNDGSMRTGSAVKVELSDGVYTFGFAQSGRAYGNRNTLQRHNNVFYINGLRLEPEEDWKLGIVCDRQAHEYYVVGSGGRVRDKNHTALDDGDGGKVLVIGGRYAGYCVLDDGQRIRWTTRDGVTGFWLYDRDAGDTEAERWVECLAESGDESSWGTLDEAPDELRLNFSEFGDYTAYDGK